MKLVHSCAALVLLVLVLSSCASPSSNTDPVTAPLSVNNAGTNNGTYLWGLFEFHLDPVTETIEVVPLRTAEVEVNVLLFLEPPSGPSFITVSNGVWNPPEVAVDVRLTHPFAGFPEYMGFSVRGVLLTNGALHNFDNQSIITSTPNQLRLVNADGYTRWMNPDEFPFDGTIFNYYPGAMGDVAGDLYKSTVNPYKLYADGLTANPDNMDLDESNMSMFSDGAQNERRYELNFNSTSFGVFQYAVIASTDTPTVYPPAGPGDFPLGTVASEPWRVDITELQSDLWYNDNTNQQGGALNLQVDVFDFENADLDEVYIEAPGVFPRQQMPLIGQVGNQLTFQLSVANIDLNSADTFDMLVSAIAPDGEGYDGRLPGEELATYMLWPVDVYDGTPEPPEWPFYDDFETYNYIWTPHGGEWWGKLDGFMNASGGPDGGGTCFEEDTGSADENLNMSFVTSPSIDVPDSTKDLVIIFNHTIEVDIPEEFGHFAWDMCFFRVNGEQVFPTGGPSYEDNFYPWTFDEMKCWTTDYPMTESTFNLGTDLNGTTITVDFVLDTYDYIDNCDPPNFGWLIDDILVDFAD